MAKNVSKLMKVAPKYVSAISANSCIKVLKLKFYKILKMKC